MILRVAPTPAFQILAVVERDEALGWLRLEGVGSGAGAGNDTGSDTSPATLRRLIRESEVIVYALGIDDSRPVAVLSRLASEGIEARLRIAVPDYLPGNLIDGRDGSFYFFGTTPFYSGAAYDVALYRVSWPGPAAPRGLRIPR